jgi:hypothetical protein
MEIECFEQPEFRRVEQDAIAPPKDAAPAFAAEFIKDVTIPDNTVIAIGTTITKVWRILNVGTDAWVNCELVAASSLDEMLGPTSTTLDLPFCLGGCWCDVAVEFCIPESAAIGCTRSTWHLHSGDGQRFDVNYCRDLFMDVEVVPE